MKPVRPLNDLVLVKRKEREAVTAGGLHIPDSRQVKSRFAEVLAVGPGRFIEATFERRPISVKPGDVVFFRGTSGQEIELGDEEGLVMLREDELEAVVDEP